MNEGAALDGRRVRGVVYYRDSRRPASGFKTDADSMASYRVVVVPVLSDNFAYLLVDTATSSLAAVDPAGELLRQGAQTPLLLPRVCTDHEGPWFCRAREAHRSGSQRGSNHQHDPHDTQALVMAIRSDIPLALSLSSLLVLSDSTHDRDHAGGNLKMAELLPGVTVVGGAKEGCDGCTHMVQHGDIVKLGDTSIQCLDTPLYVFSSTAVASLET